MIRVFASRARPLALAAGLMLACAPALTVQAAAKTPLSQVAEVEDVLFSVAVASELAKRCDSLSARKMKGLGVLMSLKSRANELGYSDAEIRAHVESKTEKARMRAKGEAFLVSNGVRLDQPETFCAFGRAEIAKSSAIGALLRAK